jgi:hypothetical protein
VSAVRKVDFLRVVGRVDDPGHGDGDEPPVDAFVAATAFLLAASREGVNPAHAERAVHALLNAYKAPDRKRAQMSELADDMGELVDVVKAAGNQRYRISMNITPIDDNDQPITRDDHE